MKELKFVSIRTHFFVMDENITKRSSRLTVILTQLQANS